MHTALSVLSVITPVQHTDTKMSLLINPFAADNTLMCGWRFKHAKHITFNLLSMKHVFASELLGNVENMFPRYWY